MLAGTIGPGFGAALGTSAQRTMTISRFLLPVREGVDLCEVIAALQRQGLDVLYVGSTNPHCRTTGAPAATPEGRTEPTDI